jgi:hypothetical protein
MPILTIDDLWCLCVLWSISSIVSVSFCANMRRIELVILDPWLASLKSELVQAANLLRPLAKMHEMD